MNPERHAKIGEIFQSAVDLPPGRRGIFLEEACEGDHELRAEVESLLSAHEKSGDFIEDSAADVAASLLGENRQHPTRVGPYKIERLLGAGGMGEVFLAHDTRLNRPVALKLLSTHLTKDEERVRRFRLEALAASALNHPNILTIYEIEEDGERPYIATEYVGGVTLRTLMRGKRLSLTEALDIALQIAGALAAAHGAGIVHRDIKPENIMIRPDGLVKVLDFGIAKHIQPAGARGSKESWIKTATGVIVGTAAYMSPEQARGLQVDARTDIWSLGCVLYEMVAGRAPFTGETLMDLLVAVVEREPPPLKKLASEQIPAEFEWIITKTLSKNPDERYQTSKELLADLQRLRQKLEIESHLECSTLLGASVEPATAKIAEHPAAKHMGRLRRIRPTPRAAVYAAVLTTLTLGALAYVWRWRQSPVAPRAEIKSLAVLPLRSLDAGENYLGLGIADALIRRISQTGELIVRPTSAVRRYLNEDTDAITAARQLNADAVLEGSMQRAGDQLRVSVNLLRTSDGASLWADNFDMRMTDIFTIQDRVAQEVAARLRLQLDPSQQARFVKRYTSNPIAYEFYLKGVYSFDQRQGGAKAKYQVEASIDFFKKAIAADQNYALAHAQLALAYAWVAQFVEPAEAVWTERAKVEIDRAEALDPQLAETHVARHYILRSAYGGWQIEAAIRELLLAQQLNPDAGLDQLGVLYSHIGLEDLFEREMQRALDVDPTSEYVKNATVNSYENLHLYDECLAAEQKYFNGEPRVSCLLGKGRLDEAQARIEQALTKEPDDADAHRLKAIFLALKGDFRAAEAEIPFLLSRRSVKDFAYHHLTYDIACIYALAGESYEAIKWLRKTAATGFPCYPLFARDPYLDRIRQAPEFTQYMAEMQAQFERYKREFT